MRIIFITILTTGLLGCGETPTSNGTDAAMVDATSDAVGSGTDAAADGLGNDTTGTDTVAGDTAGTDATGGEVASSDSPWHGTVFINEIHAGGSKTPTVATDADWFELYNVGTKAMDLSLCKVGGLTNGIAGANVLPAGTTLGAGAFLVVYYNHLNLGVPVIDAGIKSDGSMALWDTSGLLVDSIDWNEGASPSGASYDRTPDGSATWKTVSPPTPGQANSK